MAIQYFGRVLFANGRSAAGVSVRIFDRDEPGKGDDDLTIQPGISDQSGHFVVSYSPSRYLDTKIVQAGGQLSHLFDWAAEKSSIRAPDLSDNFQPYLKLDYSMGGQPRTGELPFSPFKTVVQLPETLPLDFLPSRNGFRFVNSFPGLPLPFNIPGLPAANKTNEIYGLCGGMASGAYDYYLAGRPVPDQDQNTAVPPPKKGTKLHTYLYRRLIDSFGLGVPLVKLAKWMTMPVDGPLGLQKCTYDAFETGEGDSRSIRLRLDAQEAVQLALVYDKANTGQEVMQNIFNNHQVLATGYQDLPGGDVEIRIYDPNYPLQDDITILAQKVTAGSPAVPGYQPVQKIGNRGVREVFAFFSMPYSPVEPTV